MTLHPDVLTDLVVLYHVGEASQASRALLEEEATRNPQIAAALAAGPRPMAPLPVSSEIQEGKVLRKVRLRYQVISFGAVWMLALIAIAVLPRFISTPAGMEMAINLMPLAVLVVFFAAAAGALYFFIRAARR